jgi:hypothetical protein
MISHAGIVTPKIHDIFMILYCIALIHTALDYKQCKIHVKYSIILGYFDVVRLFWPTDAKI